MKLLIALSLFACCILLANAQPVAPTLNCNTFLNSTTTIWANLGATDALRIAAVTGVTLRAFGLLLAHECLGYHFYATPPNLPQQFINFLSTAFGGNDGTQNNTLGIGYRIHNQTANPFILSNNIPGLLAALLTIHTALSIQISKEDQLAFKLAVVAVLNSFGVPAAITCNITGLLNATDASIVSNAGAFSRACPTRDPTIGTIVYKNPINPNPTNVTIATVPTIICWVWSDNAPHSVLVVGTNTVTSAAFGFGYDPASPAVNTLSNSTLCALGSAACTLGLGPFTACLRFDATTTGKTYNYQCGIHGAAMSTNIIVSAATTGASASPSPGAGTATAGVSVSPSPSPNTSSASVLSSFFSWF